MNELEVGTSRQHAADQSAADTAAENGDQPTLAERRVAGVDGHADLDSEIAQVFEPRRRQYEIRHGVALDQTAAYVTRIEGRSHGMIRFAAALRLDRRAPTALRASVPGHRDDSGVAAPTASAARLFVTTWGNLPNPDKSDRTAPKQAGELLAVVVTSKKSQRLLELKAEPHVIAASADGKRVALGFADGTVQVIDGAGGKQLMAFAYGTLSGSGTNTRTEHIAFTPDGNKLVTIAQDRNLRLHDASTGKLIGEPIRVPGGASALAISADGKTVFTGDNDGRLQRWDLLAR